MQWSIKSSISRGKTIQGKSKTKKRKSKHGKNNSSQETKLYSEGIQYYKQFLKSITSVKSVSQYFAKT